MERNVLDKSVSYGKGPHSSAIQLGILVHIKLLVCSQPKGKKKKTRHQVLPSRGFSLCLHVEKISLLWLSVAPSGLNIMKNFSLRHRGQLLVVGLKGAHFDKIFHEILKGVLSFFSFQMYSLRPVPSIS